MRQHELGDAGDALGKVRIGPVHQWGLADFDDAALQNAAVRPLTQAVSAHLYAITVDDEAPAIDGIGFLSRFGADQELWTLFEQSAYFAHTDLAATVLSPFDTHVRVAFRTLRLTSDPV